MITVVYTRTVQFILYVLFLEPSADNPVLPTSTCPPFNLHIWDEFEFSVCPREGQSDWKLFDATRNLYGHDRLVEIYSVGAGGILSVAWKSSQKISIVQWSQRRGVDASITRFRKYPGVPDDYRRYRIFDPMGSVQALVAMWNRTLQTAVLTVADGTTRYAWNFIKNVGSRLQQKHPHETLYKICMKVDEEKGGNKTGAKQDYCLAASRNSVRLETIDTCTTSRCIFTLCEEQRLVRCPSGYYRYSDCWWT